MTLSQLRRTRRAPPCFKSLAFPPGFSPPCQMPRKAAPRAPAPRPSIPSVIGDDEIVMHRSSLATAAIASDDDFDITQLDDIPTATGPTGRSKSSKRKVNAVSGRAASKKAETSDPSFAANRSKAVGSSRRKPVASTVESSQSPTLPPTSSVSGSEEGKARRSRVARAGDAFPPSVTDEEAVNMVWRGALTEIQAPQPEAVVLKPAKPLPRASQPSALNATAPESSGDEDASYMRQNTSASKRKRCVRVHTFVLERSCLLAHFR